MLKTLLNIKNKFQETNEVTKKDWLIYGLVAIFLFTCFVYWDMFATTLHTTNFIEVISQGKFLDFYKINYQFDVNGIISTACYEIPIYFIFMIWDLPLWVLQHFLNINMDERYTYCIFNIM